MKKILSITLSILIMLSSLSFAITSFADDTPTANIEKTQLGTSNTFFEYDLNSKVLTISGTGATPSFSSNGQNQPWYDWRSDLIETVIFEEGITAIGNYFLYQTQASNITLPSTLKTIGNYVFYSNSKLTEIDIPFGVTSIGTQAFRYCSKLSNVNLPDTLLTIGSNAFEGCKALEEIEIPYSITTIYSKAFFNCTALASVKFQSLTSSVKIGDYCFVGCANLKELTVPLNATMSKASFGYKTTTTKYTDAKMNVYSESNGYNYAISNAAYSIYDIIDIDVAIANTNAYTDDNISKKHIYRFVPKTTEKYNIYSRGDCDVEAIMTHNSTEIATTEDISLTDKNFCISMELTAGEEYIITVSSLKSTGTYTLWVYPDSIASIDIKSKPVIANAAADMKKVDENLLSGFIINVNFTNGLTDKIYYKNDFFNGTYLKQKEVSFTCGEANGAIEIGDVYAEYPLTIEHTFNSKEVKYTVDEDGYTLYSCVLCDSNYKDDYVKTPSITIVGKLVFPNSNNKPFTHIDKIVVKESRISTNRTYYVDENGNFELHSFNNFDAEFFNKYSQNYSFSQDVSNAEPYSTVDLGTIVVNAYDFNNDQKINAKDYAIYLKEKRSIIPKDYIEFFKANLNR